MDLLQNVCEYYEELFPVTKSQKVFYNSLISEFNLPIKFLSVNCGTGEFEHALAKEGHNVTGIEECDDLLESANRRRRTQLMFLRFFKMNYLEMTRFLGKKFYNIISILENRISFIHDKTIIKKFFFDCKELLTEKGYLILKLYNYEKFTEKNTDFPLRESIRVKLFSKIKIDLDGKKTFFQELETGNGKRISVTKDAEFYPLKQDEIQQFAKEAGFNDCKFYGDFDLNPFTTQSDELLAVIK